MFNFSPEYSIFSSDMKNKQGRTLDTLLLNTVIDEQGCDSAISVSNPLSLSLEEGRHEG